MAYAGGLGGMPPPPPQQQQQPFGVPMGGFGAPPPGMMMPPQPPPPQPQRPVFPGTASLVDQLDRRVLAVLRDGRHILGTLRSFDQFANVVLEGAVERRHVGTTCADVPVGLYVLRGDNIALLGQVDAAKEAKLNVVSLEEFRALQETERGRLAVEQEAGLWDFDAF